MPATWDIVKFHWVLDVYLTARESLNLTYYEIASRYPVKAVYSSFNPLHETSELNALSKMNFDRVELCGCIINNKYYLYKNDVPEDKRYLLDKYDEAKFRKGIIYMNTVFFHLIDEPNGYLSNWYPSEFVISGRKFNCVEQYMMWKKAELFGDLETAERILKESNPAKIKKLGREVKGYVDSKWAAVRYDIVRDALLAKFEQNEELKSQMLSSSGIFAECAVNDHVWGIGIGMNDPDRIDRCKWNGMNLLGLALEEVYNILKA